MNSNINTTNTNNIDIEKLALTGFFESDQIEIRDAYENAVENTYSVIDTSGTGAYKIILNPQADWQYNITFQDEAPQPLYEEPTYTQRQKKIVALFSSLIQRSPHLLSACAFILNQIMEQRISIKVPNSNDASLGARSVDGNSFLSYIMDSFHNGGSQDIPLRFYKPSTRWGTIQDYTTTQYHYNSYSSTNVGTPLPGTRTTTTGILGATISISPPYPHSGRSSYSIPLSYESAISTPIFVITSYIRKSFIQRMFEADFEEKEEDFAHASSFNTNERFVAYGPDSFQIKLIGCLLVSLINGSSFDPIFIEYKTEKSLGVMYPIEITYQKMLQLREKEAEYITNLIQYDDFQ